MMSSCCILSRNFLICLILAPSHSFSVSFPSKEEVSESTANILLSVFLVSLLFLTNLLSDKY